MTLPSVPAGGAEDPSKLNLYMLTAAADPGTGSGTMKLQSTTTATAADAHLLQRRARRRPGLEPTSPAAARGPAVADRDGADSVKAPWATQGDGTKSGSSGFVRIRVGRRSANAFQAERHPSP